MGRAIVKETDALPKLLWGFSVSHVRGENWQAYRISTRGYFEPLGKPEPMWKVRERLLSKIDIELAGMRAV